MQGTTSGACLWECGKGISIHVPIAGNDNNVLKVARLIMNFNPRSHCRERPKAYDTLIDYQLFQSTFPLQGTTIFCAHKSPAPFYFNPRSHCRERPTPSALLRVEVIFQSTFPLQGTTELRGLLFFAQIISIHVPIAGNDIVQSSLPDCLRISIHVPIAGNDENLPYDWFDSSISIHVPIAGNDSTCTPY